VAYIDKLAAAYVSEGYEIEGRRHPEDLVRLQRALTYTTHVEDVDPRYVVCVECLTRRKFGA
jgi:hypothetical protein